MLHRLELKGWALTGWCAVGILALVVGILTVQGFGIESLMAIVRVTGRSSAVLFAIAFTASSLRLSQKPRSNPWLSENYEFLGLGFAFSHFVHLAVLAMLAMGWSDTFFGDNSLFELVAGGIVYLWLAIMSLVWIRGMQGLQTKRVLRFFNGTGEYYTWIAFAQIYIPVALTNPIYFLLAIAIVAILPLRFFLRYA